MRDGDRSKSLLYVMNADGRDPHPLGGQIEILGRPAVSPDGKQILFAGPAPEGLRLFLMDVTGSAPRAIGDPDSVEPAWSPDGKFILFTSVAGNNNELYRMGADGGGMTRLTDNLDDDGGAAW
jgi:TolB protein